MTTDALQPLFGKGNGTEVLEYEVLDLLRVNVTYRDVDFAALEQRRKVRPSGLQVVLINSRSVTNNGHTFGVGCLDEYLLECVILHHDKVRPEAGVDTAQNVHLLEKLGTFFTVEVQQPALVGQFVNTPYAKYGVVGADVG